MQRNVRTCVPGAHYKEMDIRERMPWCSKKSRCSSFALLPSGIGNLALSSKTSYPPLTLKCTKHDISQLDKGMFPPLWRTHEDLLKQQIGAFRAGDKVSGLEYELNELRTKSTKYWPRPLNQFFQHQSILNHSMILRRTKK